MAYEFNNPLHWDLVLRDSFEQRPLPTPEGETPRYLQIPNINRVVDSRILMIGTNCNHANPWWKSGGKASLNLLTLPSSISDYVAAVEDADNVKRCRLFKLSLMIFPDLGFNQYLLNLEVPYYFRQFSCEIWKYSGPIPVGLFNSNDTTVEINLSG